MKLELSGRTGFCITPGRWPEQVRPASRLRTGTQNRGSHRPSDQGEQVSGTGENRCPRSMGTGGGCV